MGYNVVEVASVLGLAWVIVRVLGPFASALAKRLERPAPLVAAPDPQVPQLRAELEDLQERLDFIERALAAQQHQTDRVLPPQSRRADPEGRTAS